MPASTVPSAKVALKALLEGWVWPGDAPVVRWGAPTEAEDMTPGGQLIYFGTAPSVTERDWSLGATASKEVYNIRLVIDVRQYGDDEQATELRAYELYAAVTDLLDANRTLSGTLIMLGDRTFEPANFPIPAEWLCRITIDQTVTGHIAH
jgi:hypothetical protein